MMRAHYIKDLIIPISVIIVAGSFLFYNTLDNVFVLDDFVQIKDNLQIRSLSAIPYFLTRFFDRSIFYISLTLDYHVHKLDPFGYHLSNIIIHLLNAILLYLCLFVIGKSSLFLFNSLFNAFIPAFIFLVHPLQVNVINHIATRSIMLCTIFYLAGILLYMSGHYHQKKQMRAVFYVGALLMYMLCVGSKSIGVTFPFILIIIYLIFSRCDSESKREGIGWSSVLIVITTIIIIGVVAMGHVWRGSLHGILPNLMTQITVIWRYVFLMVYPVNVVPEYEVPLRLSFDVVVGTAAVGIILLIVFALWKHKKYPLISFGILWLFITIAPSSSIIPRTVPMLTYRTYLPVIGFCICSGALMQAGYRLASTKMSRLLYTIVLFIILTGLCSLTAYSNNVYDSNVRLWRTVQTRFPKNPVPYYNIGTFLLREGNVDGAIQHFKDAIRYNPDFAKAHFHLGLALHKKGLIEGAITSYRRALSIRPYSSSVTTQYDIFINLGNAYLAQGAFEDALNAYRIYLRQKGPNAPVYNNIANVYRQMGNRKDARALLSRAIDLDPYNEQYRKQCARWMREDGNFKQAIMEYKKLLSYDPQNSDVLFELGITYQQNEKMVGAIRMYQAVLSIDKNHIGAMNNLGTLYFQTERYDDAEEAWQSVILRDPRHIGAQMNLQKLQELRKQMKVEEMKK